MMLPAALILGMLDSILSMLTKAQSDAAHSPSEVVETLWWQARSPVTSQLRQLPQPVTLLLKQCGGKDRLTGGPRRKFLKFRVLDELQLLKANRAI
jgi:hypothetical protein